MTAPATPGRFTPGSLVRARGREWVVLPESDDSLLVVRPLGGSDDEISGMRYNRKLWMSTADTEAAYPPE